MSARVVEIPEGMRPRSVEIPEDIAGALARAERAANVQCMVSINDAHEKTGLPATMIRRLALAGEIPAIRSGSKKIWINLGGLLDYLSTARI